MSTEKSAESIKTFNESNIDSDQIHAAVLNETSSITVTTAGLGESDYKKGNKTFEVIVLIT